MRIISGKLKGKNLLFLKSSTTRPLKDSVKENIFNILKHSNLIDVQIENSDVLDLYSGVGSFGIECISRGASKVAFVEKDKSATNILRENLNKLSILNRAQLFNFNIDEYLKQSLKNKFNIFFFDPPFIDKSFIKNLILIKKKKLFKKKHIIIIHRERKSEEFFEKYIKVINIKVYGRSKIIFGSFN